MGQGGKTSLTNTTDTDILEYILAKLAARIGTKSRTFLVKVKVHRGEPLNEGADDLVETGRVMEKEGDNFSWQERTIRVVYSNYERKPRTMEKDTWTKTIRNTVRKKRGDGNSNGRTTTPWNK